MKSLKNGINTLKPGITNISQHGFWVLLKAKEYFISFDQYPWFENAKISSIFNVKIFHNHHLYWPELDVDLTTEILDNPENYPLIYK
jgi:hypothetical protein